MKCFITEVLEDLKSKHKSFSELLFILPSKRAGSYLKKELSKLSNKTIFAPFVISIEDFVKDLSSLESITSTEALFYFYKAYENITASDKVESFETVSSWSQTLIADFNEIDRFLIDPKSIFNYLSSLKEINAWTLNGEQTESVKNYLSFWDKLEQYYEEFKKELLKDSKGHQGLIYREAINQLENYLASKQEYHHVFVGFNALNKAENILINELLEQDKASIYWDIDSNFLHHDYHDAGLFIRQHKRSWNHFRTNPFNWETNNYSTNKNIHVAGCTKQVGQVKYVAELLNELVQSNWNLDNTAIVLGDESLLQPLLNSLPLGIERLNITMGLPLKSSALTNLFESIFSIHKNGTTDFYYKDVISILKQPQIQSIYNFRSIIEEIRSKNITYVKYSYLKHSDSKPHEVLIDLLFSNWNDNPRMGLENLLKLVALIKSELLKNKSKNKLELEYLYKYYKLFNELYILVNDYTYVTSIKALHTIFRELVSTETLDFEGDPYSGLQIMGMLESRVLDFETVIILSVNEGILPAGKTNNSFIPFEAKISNGLPTYKEKDAVYTYHFYRLLQRAKHIYLTYNTEPDVLKGGEMSRFIRQLEFEGIHKINHYIVSNKLKSNHASLITIPKDKSVIDDLESLAKRGFSPSNLTNYIRNPIDFYNQSLLGINPFEDVEETIASNTFGTIIHNTLEEIYTPFVDKNLTIGELKNQLKSLRELVTKYFKQEYKNEDYLKGKNLISFEIAKRYIENFIKQEIEVLKAGNAIKIVALEKRLSHELQFEELDFPIKIKGFVDRIDMYNDTLRIIDYKTGKVEQSKVEIVDWEHINTDYDKYSKSFQVLMYALMYSKSEVINHPIEAGIISFKNLNSGFLKFAKKDKNGAYANKNTMITKEILDDFYIQLKNLILEIFNPEIPFIEKEL